MVNIPLAKAVATSKNRQNTKTVFIFRCRFFHSPQTKQDPAQKEGKHVIVESFYIATRLFIL